MSPNDSRQIEHAGRKFRVEIWGRENPRALVYCPGTSRILFTSFECELDHARRVDWAKLSYTIRSAWDNPRKGIAHRDKYYGPKGIYVKKFPEGQNA